MNKPFQVFWLFFQLLPELFKTFRITFPEFQVFNLFLLTFFIICTLHIFLFNFFNVQIFVKF